MTEALEVMCNEIKFDIGNCYVEAFMMTECSEVRCKIFSVWNKF